MADIDANMPDPETAGAPIIASTDFSKESITALDDLMKEASADGEETPPAPEKKAAEKPAAPAAEKPAAAPEKKAEPAAPATPEPEKPAVTDDLDSVELPPYSKPKTGEAFAKVKELARNQLAQRDAELQKLRATIAERDEKLKTVLPPEAGKELEELRNFRRSVDIENDPEFRGQFDNKIEANNNAILSKLADVGMSPEQIESIKKLGGPEKVDWEPLLPKLPLATRSFVQTKLGQNEDIREDRKNVIAQARKDPGKFETQRQEAQAKVLVDTANGYLKSLPWTAEKAIPAKATPEERSKIEAENAIAKKAQDVVQGALKSYNPQTFAELAVATAMAHKFQHDSQVAGAQVKQLTEALEKTQTERDAARGELEKIKKAGSTHRRSTTTPPPAPPSSFDEPGMSALDRLRDELVSG